MDAGALDPGLFESRKGCGLSHKSYISRIRGHGPSPCPGLGTCSRRQGVERVPVGLGANWGPARVPVPVPQDPRTCSGRTRHAGLELSCRLAGRPGRQRPAVSVLVLDPTRPALASRFPRPPACPGSCLSGPPRISCRLDDHSLDPVFPATIIRFEKVHS